MRQGSYTSRKYLAGSRWVDNSIYFIKSYWIESIKLVFIKKYWFLFSGLSLRLSEFYGSLLFTHTLSHCSVISAREKGSFEENTK